MQLRWSDIEHELFIIAMTKKVQPFRSGREVESAKRTPNRNNKPIRNHRNATNLTKEQTVVDATSPTFAPSVGDQTTHRTNAVLKTEKKTLGTTNQLLNQTELSLSNQNPQNQARQAMPVQTSKMPIPVG